MLCLLALWDHLANNQITRVLIMSETIKSVVSEAKNYKKLGDIVVSSRTGGISFKYLLGLALLLPPYTEGSTDPPIYTLTLAWSITQTTPYQFYGNGKQQAPFVAIMCAPKGYKVQWENLSFYDKVTGEHYGTQFTQNTRAVITDNQNDFSHGIFNSPRVADARNSTSNCAEDTDTIKRMLYLMSDRYENVYNVCASYEDESSTPPLKLNSCLGGDVLIAKTIAPFKYHVNDYVQSNIQPPEIIHHATFFLINTNFVLKPTRDLPHFNTYPLISEKYTTGGIGNWNQCERYVETTDIDNGEYLISAFYSGDYWAEECDMAYRAQHEITFTDEYGNAGSSNVTFCFDETSPCEQSPSAKEDTESPSESSIL